MALLFGIVAVVQLLLHYLGWGGIVLGILAIIFGNPGRGTELLFGGIGLVVLKYVIGLGFYLLAGALGGSRTPSNRSNHQ